MFKALILQTQHNLSDNSTAFMIRDRLPWMRFLGFELGGPTPDENTIRHSRDRMIETGTFKGVMKAFDGRLRKKGYIPKFGQGVDARPVPAPRRRTTDAEKEASKRGKTAAEIWPDDPAKSVQKDVNARRPLKMGGKVPCKPDSTPLPQIATPVFGYKSHISIDRRFGFIRQAVVTSAAARDGRQLKALVTTDNLSSEVWAESVYRSKKNEAWLAKAALEKLQRYSPAALPPVHQGM